jgi:hypothetical protein
MVEPSRALYILAHSQPRLLTEGILRENLPPTINIFPTCEPSAKLVSDKPLSIVSMNPFMHSVRKLRIVWQNIIVLIILGVVTNLIYRI